MRKLLDLENKIQIAIYGIDFKAREAKKQEKFLQRRKKIWEKNTATTSAPLKRIHNDEIVGIPEADE